jgi:hypothetical protein
MKSIVFTPVVSLCDDLQVPVNMQATHDRTVQWADVIDFVRNTCCQRQSSGLLIHLYDVVQGCPWRSSRASNRPSVSGMGINNLAIRLLPSSHRSPLNLWVCSAIALFSRAYAICVGLTGRLVSRSSTLRVGKSIGLSLQIMLVAMTGVPLLRIRGRFTRIRQTPSLFPRKDRSSISGVFNSFLNAPRVAVLGGARLFGGSDFVWVGGTVRARSCAVALALFVISHAAVLL